MFLFLKLYQVNGKRWSFTNTTNATLRTILSLSGEGWDNLRKGSWDTHLWLYLNLVFLFPRKQTNQQPGTSYLCKLLTQYYRNKKMWIKLSCYNLNEKRIWKKQIPKELGCLYLIYKLNFGGQKGSPTS